MWLTQQHVACCGNKSRSSTAACSDQGARCGGWFGRQTVNDGARGITCPHAGSELCSRAVAAFRPQADVNTGRNLHQPLGRRAHITQLNAGGRHVCGAHRVGSSSGSRAVVLFNVHLAPSEVATARVQSYLLMLESRALHPSLCAMHPREP